MTNAVRAYVAALTIDEITVIPIRVPLPKTYRGSHYQMTHRSTVICQIKTREGVLGEAWAGDEDAGLGDRRDHPE
jgi:hypothetical protein